MVKIKEKKKKVKLVEPVELTPREKAWEDFKKTMEKYDPEKFKRMTASGELDKIPVGFTF